MTAHYLMTVTSRLKTVFVVALIACSASPASPSNDGMLVTTVGSVRIEYFEADQSRVETYRAGVSAGVANAETFAGLHFQSGFGLHVYPTRVSLTTYWRTAWNDPALDPQCWMIASSNRESIAFLSPRIWTSENCGHDGNSTAYVSRVIAHETIHILQAQNNPAADINAVQQTKWLNEGVAVLGSGQFDDDQAQVVRQLVQGGFVPASLAAIWTGQQGYAVSGSLTKYIDTRWGRGSLRQIILKTNNADILTVLGVSESELISAWKQSVLQ